MYVLFILLVNMLSAGQDCANFSQPQGPFEFDVTDIQEHTSGFHEFDQLYSGSCAYTGRASPSAPVGCSLTATAYSSTSTFEDGSLADPLYTHYGNHNDKDGTTSSSGGSAGSADAEGAAAFQSCLFSCSTTINITGSGNGSGFGVVFTPTPLWGRSHNYLNSCTGMTLPKRPLCDPEEAPYNAPEGYKWVFNAKTCQWQLVWSPSPVIVDTTGKGFHMSDPNQNWVTFDLLGDGTFHRFSWPEHGSGNAWLVYDVNDDGIITNGKELFGSYTPHADGGVPHNPATNGFMALAWYDKRAQGGNGDLVLDKQDAIWNHLKLWIDDHCYLTPNAPCTSVPSEVHSLESAGIKSIALVYEMNPASGGGEDAYGNDFRIYVPLNVEPQQDKNNTKDPRTSKDPRVMYDVFLRVADQ
jgi:hypothetical protein